MMDFIWSPFTEPELGCVCLLCRFLWWKTQAMPDLTSTRNKKSMCRDGEGGGGGITRETWFQEFWGCGITQSKRHDRLKVNVQYTKTLKQTRRSFSSVVQYTLPNSSKMVVEKLHLSDNSKRKRFFGVCKDLYTMQLPITDIRTDL